MRIEFRQAEDFQATAHELLEAYTGGVREAPPVRNVGAVLALGESFRFRWRGIDWEVPPVSFEDGARALSIARWIDEVRKDPEGMDPETYREMMGRAVDLVARCVRPVSRLRRLFYPIRSRSMWATAGDAEIGMMVGFSLRRRMKSPDRRLSGHWEDVRKR